MTRSVLHIHDHAGAIDGFMLANLMHVSRGEPITLHIDREDGTTDIVPIGREGKSGPIMVASRGAGNCGCP